MTELAEVTNKTKSSFVKVGKKYRPKFRKHSLLTTWHLNYFKPIEVPEKYLMNNGLVKETITVNPLTGTVEVNGMFFSSSFNTKNKYNKDYRIWSLNERAREVLNDFLDIKIGDKIYSREISTNQLNKLKSGEDVTGIVYSANKISSSNVILMKLFKTIGDEYIRKINSINLNVKLKIKNTDKTSNKLLNYRQNSENPILANRDIRLPLDNNFSENIELSNLSIDNVNLNNIVDNPISFINNNKNIVFLPDVNNSDYLKLYEYNYSFIPETDDLVEYYEKLVENKLYNKKLNGDIYLDDILSDDLYNPAYQYKTGNLHLVPREDIKFGISLGKNSDIKEVEYLSFILPIAPKADAIFEHKKILMGLINKHDFLNSNLKNILYNKDIVQLNGKEYQSFKNVSHINFNFFTGSNYVNYYNDVLEESITRYNSNLSGVYMNSISLFDINLEKVNNIPNYLGDNFYKSKQYHLFTKYGDNSIIGNDVDNRYYSLSKDGYTRLSNKINGSYTNIISMDSIRNMYIDDLKLGNGKLLNRNGHAYNALINNYYTSFGGLGWLKNNLYITNGIKDGILSNISLTHFTKWIREYYNSREDIKYSLDLSNKYNNYSKFRISDGQRTDIASSDKFDETLPSPKFNLYSYPLALLFGSNAESEDTYYPYSNNRYYNHAGEADKEIIDNAYAINIYDHKDFNDGPMLTRMVSDDRFLDRDDFRFQQIQDIDYYINPNGRESIINNIKYRYPLNQPYGLDHYLFNRVIYNTPEGYNIDDYISNDYRDNQLNIKADNHNFLFNIPLGSSNYFSDKLLKDKIPLDLRNTRDKSFSDFPFNRMLPKMLNTFDAASIHWLSRYYYKRLSDNLLSTSSSLYPVFDFFHKDSYIENNQGIFREFAGCEYNYGRGNYQNFSFSSSFKFNLPDISFSNGLKDIANRMSLVYGLSPEYIYTHPSYYNRYNNDNRRDTVYNFSLKYKSEHFRSIYLSKYDYNLVENDKIMVTDPLFRHPIYLYIVGAYDILYNRSFSTINHILGYDSNNPIDSSRLIKYKIDIRDILHTVYAAPFQLQTATAFALATGESSYFYTPSPACGILDNYIGYDISNNAKISNNSNQSLLTYFPSLPSYLSGIMPVYFLNNGKYENYNEYKRYGNIGLDLSINRFKTQDAIKNVIPYKPINYHSLMTNPYYPEVTRCLTAFLLADWCKVSIKINGVLKEYRYINNFMVRYDINGDNINYAGTPIVEDIGTQGTSMTHIINNVWNSRVEDVYDIDIRNFHGGFGFAINGCSHDSRMIDQVRSMETLVNLLDFCSPCLPFGESTFKAPYPIQDTDARFDYVEDIRKEEGKYNPTTYEHYAPANGYEIEEEFQDNHEGYNRRVEHIEKLSELLLRNITKDYGEYKDDSIYKNSVYNDIINEKNKNITFSKEGINIGGNTYIYANNNDIFDKVLFNTNNTMEYTLEFHLNPIFGVPNNKVSFAVNTSDVNEVGKPSILKNKIRKEQIEDEILDL